MKRKRILIADRDKDVARSIGETLKDEYSVLYVRDGRLIERVVRESQVDLLLTDINLPHISFYSTLQKIKTEFPGLPVIIMYVYCDCPAEMENNIRRMADATYLKPFDVVDLKKRIDELLYPSGKEIGEKPIFPRIPENQVVD
ncbi:MAG: hypothetical protein Kow0037_14360 [Calditrichia bacterium]